MFHISYLLVLIVLIMVILGPFILLAFGMIKLRRPPTQLPISEDGRWRWDGEKWVPNELPRP